MNFDYRPFWVTRWAKRLRQIQELDEACARLERRMERKRKQRQEQRQRKN